MILKINELNTVNKNSGKNVNTQEEVITSTV